MRETCKTLCESIFDMMRTHMESIYYSTLQRCSSTLNNAADMIVLSLDYSHRENCISLYRQKNRNLYKN